MKFNFTDTQKQLINLTVDYKKGVPATCFSTNEDRVQAINDKFFSVLGTTTPDEMVIDANKHAIFAIIKEIAKQTITNDGAEASAFYSSFVNEDTVPLGDTKEIEIENDSYLTVGKISGNNWNLKRERVDKGEVVPIKVSTFYVGIYEYVKRVATGRADFVALLDKVAESIRKHKDDFITTKFTEALNGIPAHYKYQGQYIEKEILKRISRVKAANKGSRVVLMGTVEALASLQGSSNLALSNNMMDEMNNTGYLGKWKGNDMVALPTVYKENTEEFAFDNDTIYIVPAGQKMVEIVNEGEPIVKEASLSWTENMDMSQDYYVIWKMGAIILFNKMMGTIKITQ